MEISKEEFLKLPEVPGVYTFWKKNSTSETDVPISGTDIPIYIGKSINLKSRLNSYLAIRLGPKTQQMVSEADSVTYVEVGSDLESLLLEAQQIKKYKPKYNIVLKDDKQALYILITDEKFPRVITCRKLYTVNHKQAYGPFPNSGNVKSILRMIRKIFPYSDHKIGKTSLPLRGKKPCLYSHLGLCNPCPNLIINTQSPRIKQKLTKQYKQNLRNVKLVLSRKFNIVRNSLEKEMYNLSKLQKYEDAKIVYDRINTLDYITQKKNDASQFLENPNLSEDIRAQELDALRAILNKVTSSSNSLKRIECFDMSHLSGISATASMSVLINGSKANSEYKHFKIKQKNGQSDYDSMREIAKRRNNHIKDWGRPDLIIVDGGLGQVKIFDIVFKLQNIPVVGIAKHPDRLIFPDGSKLSLKGATHQLVSRIRDEAHRFARRLHHKIISRSLLT